MTEQERNNNNGNNIKLISRKKWFWVGLIIAIINPVFSGLVLGAAFLSEPELKKEGRVIITVAIIWGVAVLFLSRWLVRQGYFNIGL